MTQNPAGQGFKQREYFISKGPLEAVVPNPKANLMDLVREVMRLRHVVV